MAARRRPGKAAGEPEQIQLKISGSPTPVHIPALAEDLPSPKVRDLTVRQAGMKLALVMCGVLLAALFAIGLYAFGSRPDPSLYLGLSSQKTELALAAYADARTEWITSIKDLVQIALVTLFLPLTATVIAATLDVRRSQEP